MTVLQMPKADPASGGKARSSRLFVLELSGGRIHSMNTDGSDRKTIVTDCRLPDGIAVDVEAGHIYWTNMGVPSLNDGSIERVDLDGRNRRTIVPQGGTFTPKQIQIDKKDGKLYWCDREGMRVMRANLDGSRVETLVETGRGGTDRRDATRWCVGITIDPRRNHIYWTQKGPDNAGLGRIFRANVEIYWAGSSAPMSRSRKARARLPAATSRWFSTGCLSRLTSSSISRTARCTGPTGAILRAAIRSIAHRSTANPMRAARRRS